MTFPRPNLPSRCGSRSGFTLVEILVVIAIIALLAGVALPAVTGALKKARESAAVQSAHGLATAMFQYSTDNSGVFPGKTTAVTVAGSSDIFNGELVPTYISNTDTLFISGGTGSKYVGSVNPATIKTANNSWDIICHSDDTGLVANDPDTAALVMSTGATPTWPAAGAANASGAAVTSPQPPTTSPFGTDGVAVGYKDMSSAFMSAAGAGAAGTFPVTSASFIPTYQLKNEVPN